MVKRLSNTDQNNSILTGLRGPADPLDAVTKKYVDDNLAGKANTSHTHTIGQITGLQTALDGKQASGDYATVTELNSGLSSKANVSHTHAAADVTSGVFNVARIPDLAISKITNLQTTLNGKANSSHTHTIAQVTGLQTALDGKQAAGSYATTTQLNNHINDDDNPHEVTASQVGLGNVNNTSDANKPVSTAVQAALDNKVAGTITLTSSSEAPSSPQAGDLWLDPSESPEAPLWSVESVNGRTGKVTLSRDDVGLSNVDNTSDLVKNSTVASLVNKTIDGGLNTLVNIPSTSINFTKTIDANGWTVYDYGAWKEYTRRWTGIDPGSINAHGIAQVVSGLSLPVGKSPSNSLISVSTTAASASSACIATMGYNTSSSSTTDTYNVYLRNTQTLPASPTGVAITVFIKDA